MNSSSSAPRTSWLGTALIALVSGLVLLAGCTSTDSPTGSDTTEPQPTETTTATSGAGPSVAAQCRPVVDSAQKLGAEVGQFASGDASVNDVRAAAKELATAFDQARAEVGQEAQASFDRARQALQEFEDALTSQSPDAATVRQSAAGLAQALGEALTVCSGGTPTSTS